MRWVIENYLIKNKNVLHVLIMTKRVGTISIQVKVSKKTVEVIDYVISIGYAKSRADFAEKSMISKLEELGMFDPAISDKMKTLE